MMEAALIAFGIVFAILHLASVHAWGSVLDRLGWYDSLGTVDDQDIRDRSRLLRHRTIHIVVGTHQDDTR